MENLNKAMIIRNGNVVGVGGQVSKRVTQQEYDNLGDEKYDDNILYFITDGTDEGFGINDGVVSEFSTYSSSKIDDELTRIDGELAKRNDLVYISNSGVNNVLYYALNSFGYNPRARVYRLVVEIFGSSSPSVYARYVYAYQHEVSIERYQLEFNGLTDVDHNIMGSVSASSSNSGETFTYKVSFVY